MPSASHPGQDSAPLDKLTDVTNDREPDLAHLRAGVYYYIARPSYSTRSRNTRLNLRFNPPPKKKLPVARDTNHDGVIDAQEEAASARRLDVGTDMQIHAGGANGPVSVGCQTIEPNCYLTALDIAKEIEKRLRIKGFEYLLVRRPNDRFGQNVVI